MGLFTRAKKVAVKPEKSDSAKNGTFSLDEIGKCR
jgi:hypothetical protein